MPFYHWLKTVEQNETVPRIFTGFLNRPTAIKEKNVYS